jgi:hypothetical protein
MQTEIVLVDINYSDDAFVFPVRFSVVSNGITLARIETGIPGHAHDGETFQAAMRNRIHEVTEVLDDWIRQDLRISRG